MTISVGSPPTATITAPDRWRDLPRRRCHQLQRQRHRPRRRESSGQRVLVEHRLPARHHVHPGPVVNGVKSGTFTIPTSGHDFEGNTRYRITLTVTDSNGLKDTKSVIIWPQKVNLPFDTSPSGLTVYVDGIAHTTPFVLDTLVGFNHTIEAPRPELGRQQLHLQLVVRRRRAEPHHHGAERGSVVHGELQRRERPAPAWRRRGASTKRAGRPPPMRRATTTRRHWWADRRGSPASTATP